MNKKIIKIVYNILFIILLLIAIYSIGLIFYWFKDNAQNDVIIQEKIKKKNNKTSIIDDEKTFDLKKVQKENPDTVAYLKVNLTNINYPVVQSDNNEYYLNHSFDKSKNNAGWVFMDYRNSKDLNNDNTIFYAHNRIDKSMFGSLENLLKTDLTKEFALIYVATENQKNVYQIFSVYLIEDENYYIQTNFSNEEEKQEWINNIKNRNKTNLDIKVDKNNKILTLSTCYNKNDRLVVHAKLLN